MFAQVLVPTESPWTAILLALVSTVVVLAHVIVIGALSFRVVSQVMQT